MKSALLLLALLPTAAHAVNKCVVAGKVMYTDAPCERFGGKTTKTIAPLANVVESRETVEAMRNRAVSVAPALQPAPAAPASPLPPGEGLGVRAGEQPATPSRSTNRDVCKQIDNALAQNAAAARQPNSAAAQEQLAASRRNLHEQRGRNECEKGAAGT